MYNFQKCFENKMKYLERHSSNEKLFSILERMSLRTDSENLGAHIDQGIRSYMAEATMLTLMKKKKEEI